jgi:hypothetical protein
MALQCLQLGWRVVQEGLQHAFQQGIAVGRAEGADVVQRLAVDGVVAGAGIAASAAARCGAG